MVINWFKTSLLNRFHRPELPKALCLYVTYQCNFRCRMCGIWQKDEEGKTIQDMTLDEMEKVLSDPLFRRLEFVNINGGEPNLRKDLPEIAGMLIRTFPRLKTITLNSNGVPVHQTIRNVRAVAGLCRENNICFSVSISLHDLGENFNAIAGRKHAFSQVRRTLQELKRLQTGLSFFLSVNCVITGLNLHHLDSMRTWGCQQGIFINYTLGEIRERFNNQSMRDVFVTNDQEADLIRFLNDLARDRNLFNHHAYRYKHLAGMISKRHKRRMACHYFMFGAILGSDGELYYCKDSRSLGNCLTEPAYRLYYKPANLLYRRKTLQKNTCPDCPPNTFNRFEFEKELPKYLWFLWTK